jgi:hypothetical protein
MADRVAVTHVAAEDGCFILDAFSFVECQGDVAVLAMEGVAAAWTEYEIAIAAPVQQKNNLLLSGDYLFDSAHQFVAYQVCAFELCAFECAGHVDWYHCRHWKVHDAVWQFDERVVFLALAVYQRFERWRCASEQADSRRLVCPFYRYVSAVVSWCVVLFVAWLVFFLDYDKADVF